MKTDVKINVHMHNKCRHSGGSQCFNAKYVLRMIFIDALIRFKIFFLII